MKNAIRIFLIDLKNYAKESVEILSELLEVKEKVNYFIYFEIITLMLYSFGFCNKYYLYFLILVNLLVMAYQDIKYQMIYSPYSYMILLFAVFINPHFTVSRVIGILFFPLMFYIIKKIFGNLFGEGDTELIAVLGAVLGMSNLIVVLSITILLIATFYACTRKSRFPFVPFLTTGYIITSILILCSI